MTATVNIQLVTDRAGAELALFLPYSSSTQAAREAANVLSSELLRCASGVGAGRIRAQIDTVAGVAASIALTCTTADATAGDKLCIGKYVLTCAASPDASAGEYDSAAATDDDFATSIGAAINGLNPIEFYATVATNVVTVTARRAGTAGNAIGVAKTFTTATAVTFTGSALAGGVDPAAKPTMSLTFGDVGLANETFTIGSVTITMKASAANENECTIGASAAASATNMIAVINAHSKLRGLMSAATGGSGVVTITAAFGGRIATLLDCGTNITSGTLTNSGNFSTTATATRVTDGLEWGLGLL